MLTHDEVIELVKAHRDGVALQWTSGNGWQAYRPTLEVLLDDVVSGEAIRIKPKPAECWVLKSVDGAVGACCYETKDDADTSRQRNRIEHLQAVLMREVI